MRALLIGAVLATTGCVGMQQAEDARTAMVGMPKAELYACAGVPQRTATDGELEFLTYTSSRAWVTGTKRVMTGAEHTCTATVVLDDDVVRSDGYTHTSAYSDVGHECGAIVKGCL